MEFLLFLVTCVYLILLPSRCELINKLSPFLIENCHLAGTADFRRLAVTTALLAPKIEKWL